MKYLSKINQWYNKFKRYAVTYKKGFFHLSNLANSPHTIIDSFDHMPFCKHDPSRKLMTANTMFLKAQLYYCQPAEGLFVFVSDLLYKKNLHMTNIYDKSLPMDYHFLNLHYKKQPMSGKSMLINGLTLTNMTWSVFKAGNAISDYHFKNSNELNITIYFTEAWMEALFQSSQELNSSKFQRFFASENTYLLFQETEAEANAFYEELLQLTSHNEDNAHNPRVLERIQYIFRYFIRKYEGENLTEDHFKLQDKDRKYIQRVEKILSDSLFTGFPGVEEMAKTVGISVTKLKNDFKTIHQKSLYQYYSYNQMNLAHDLISQKKGAVKDIAKLMGYENASKFTAKFKEQFGVLPSAIIDDETEKN